MEFVRMSRGSGQVPRVTLYKHRRTVVLFGMIHFAEPQFYSEILRHLEEYERNQYAILYEAIDRDCPGVDLSAVEYKKKKAYAQLGQFGIVDQYSAMQPRPTWQNTDMSLRAVCGRLDGLSAARLRSSNLHFQQMREDPLPMVRGLLHLWDCVARGTVESKIREHVPNQDVVLHARNEIAVEGIVEASASAHVVAMWGAAHVPGIVSALVDDHGFSVRSVEWITALNVARLRKAVQNHQ